MLDDLARHDCIFGPGASGREGDTKRPVTGIERFERRIGGRRYRPRQGRTWSRGRVIVDVGPNSRLAILCRSFWVPPGPC